MKRPAVRPSAPAARARATEPRGLRRPGSGPRRSATQGTSCSPPDLRFELGPVLGEEAHRRPCRGITERADRVAGDAVRDRAARLEVAGLAVAVGDPPRHLLHPARTLAARRALPARLVREELEDSPQR